MSAYERITIKPEGARRSRTGWYRVDVDGPVLLLLTPVDVNGEDRSHYEGDTLVEVRELVEKALVVRRQPARMNLHYGTLEVTD